MPRTGEISSSELRPADVPAVGAGWPAIAEFALTFNGQAAFGKACGQIASDTRDQFARAGEVPPGLDHLRAALFLEQRRFRHFGSAPRGEELRYIQALIGAIRTHLQRRELGLEQR